MRPMQFGIGWSLYFVTSKRTGRIEATDNRIVFLHSLGHLMSMEFTGMASSVKNKTKFSILTYRSEEDDYNIDQLVWKAPDIRPFGNVTSKS